MSVASPFERQMLDLINEERTSRGLDPLTLERRLNDASEDHSTWMDETLNFSHTGAGGSNPGDRMQEAGFEFSGNWTWGENIAFQSERGAPGIADDVADLHAALMNSPGHRANILNPDFEVIGIGIEEGDGRGFDAVYVTQNFARTSAPVQLDEPGTPEPTPPEDPIADGTGTDEMIGTAGNDVIQGSDTPDTIQGGDGNDTLSGSAGDDIIWGQGGRDILIGDAGRDRLDGGANNDRMTGGADADTFVFSSGLDVVMDFNTEQSGEQVDLQDVTSIIDFDDLMTGGHVWDWGPHTVLDDQDGNLMLLVNVALDDLQANDFLF